VSDRARWLQSYSGVRARIGLAPEVTHEDGVFAFRHAYCYALSRLQAQPAPRVRLVLGRDPRPTSDALARAQAAGLASACRDLGVALDLVDLGVVTTPVWQHSVRLFEAQGGVMVTASHNPLEDNGWKYATGVETFAVDPAPPGALLSPAEMGQLIRAANAFQPQPDRSPLALVVDPVRREEALSRYVDFVRGTYRMDAAGQRLVLDPNGGAACGIAGRVFAALGVVPLVINEEPGRPAHEIDVDQMRADGRHVLHDLAQRVRAERALFGLAYDFDADRGNLTYVDDSGNPRIPSPQNTAAINAAVALALHRLSGDARPAVIVVSEATSYRVHRLAAAFAAAVHEVETGEINLVARMRDLERQGQRAVVGVEGPNGGTIFAGTTCRDGSLVGAGALLAAAHEPLRRLVAETLSVPGLGPGLGGFIAALPAQRTLSERHTVREEWAAFVARLEDVFPRFFETRLAAEWERYEILYSYTRYVGPVRPEARQYGWKARLTRPGAEGFLWIRGSKTEAGLLRVFADAPDVEAARRILAVGHAIATGETAAAN
jgi:phosphomannomutase